MQYLWWFLLVATLGIVIRGYVARRRYLQDHGSLPTYMVGETASGVSIALLIASSLLGPSSAVGTTALAGSLVLLAVSIVQSVRANRRQA